MTVTQNSQFNMYQTVANLCDDYSATIATIPAFKADKETLAALILDIRRIDSEIGANRTNIAASKKQIKDEMCSQTLNVAKNIKALGIKTQDEALKTMGSVSKSSLTEGTEEECLQRCQRMAQKARTLLAQLNERGLETVVLYELDATIAQFAAIKPEPMRTKQDKSALIVQLADKFDKADTLIEIMSLTVDNFKRLDADFCARFVTAQTPIDAYTAKTKVKFVPEHSLTGERLKNFDVESPTTGFRASVNGKNNPAFPSMMHQDAHFILTKEGFAPAIAEHNKIMRGKVNKIIVKMMPL